jgi:hypothetical protein
MDLTDMEGSTLTWKKQVKTRAWKGKICMLLGAGKYSVPFPHFVAPRLAMSKSEDIDISVISITGETGKN